MKKKLIALALTLAMALGLAACGGSADPGTGSSSSPAPGSAETPSSGEHEPVTLRFYNYALAEEAKASWWQETVDKFQAENDWITIESVAVDYNSMISTFTNDLASGLSVDMIFGEVSWIPALVEGGFIQPLDQVMDADFYAGYEDFALEQMSYAGGVYGAPLYYSPSLIFVNKDLIEGAGLSMDDFPTTLDDLKTWIETLADYYAGGDVSTIFGLTTSEVSATGANIKSMLASFGGTLIAEDGTLASFEEDPNATAWAEMMDFYNYLISNGYTQENQKLKDYRAAFGAGNVCMYVDNSWGYAQIGEVDANADAFTVTAPIPTTMGTYGTGASTIQIQNLLIGNNLSDGQREAVNLFIQYVTSNEALEEYMNTVNLAFPLHAGMADCQISPILEGALPGIENIVSYVPIGAMISVETELATAVLNYTVNGMSLEDTLASYIAEANYYINQ